MLLGSIVLTGGRSQRMGKPKEALPWGDGTLLHETVMTLLDVSYPVVVVARDEDQDLPPLHTECDQVCDAQAGEGPLVGIEAGLQFAAPRCDAVFVVGCDTPFLTSGAVAWMAEQLGEHDAVVARVGDIVQPLSAVYRTSVLSLVQELLAAGERRAQALPETIASRGGKVRTLTEAEIDAFDAERKFLRSVETEADYEQARRDAGQ